MRIYSICHRDKQVRSNAVRQIHWYLSLIVCLFDFSIALAQDTFSITAIDSLTRLVGSAGASCVPSLSVRVISDVHPGVGVVHTQAMWVPANQNYARTLMSMGLAPQQIIDSLVLHDIEHNPGIRQYGIIDLVGGGRTAGYTGIDCPVYRNHILGASYTIQGNTLSGKQVLDSMQARFLNSPGTLANRLMAALQGAKAIGADTRCQSRGTSSTGAFLRVARPTDRVDSLWLDLEVVDAAPGRDPIDSLQTLYDIWRLTNDVSEYSFEVPSTVALHQNYPNPFNPSTTIKYELPKSSVVRLSVYDMLGREVSILVDEKKDAGYYEIRFDGSGLASGVYLYRLRAGEYVATKKLLLMK